MGRAYWGYGYAHMPRTEEIRQYSESLKIYYISQNYSKNDADEQAYEEAL